jgi:hypothetical protein
LLHTSRSDNNRVQPPPTTTTYLTQFTPPCSHKS